MAATSVVLSRIWHQRISKPLSNAMRAHLFNTDAELRAWLDEFFQSKPVDFYQRNRNVIVELLIICTIDLYRDRELKCALELKLLMLP